jgi:hypothetical protein
VESELAPVDFICVDPEHVRMGRGVRDGDGHLTLHQDHWAYCSAGLPNVPHRWEETGGIAYEGIRHADLPEDPAIST